MKKQILGLAIAAAFALPATAQQSVEVLHWWTAGGEAAALNVLKSNLEKQGVKWNDMPVAGGGGEAAMTAVRARVTAGNPPTAVQMLGFDILDWGKQGVVADLNELAAKEGWDKTVPKALQQFSKFNGKWIAAPVNVHSTNWVWANKAVLDKAGVTTEPKNWDEFIAAAEKVQKAGFIALAHGGQPWQEATVFDGVVLATGGVDYYRKAFIERDPKALNSATTETVFKRMSQLRKLVDKDFSGRDWNVASGMVISGKAGFQIMGDWAKGEFINARRYPARTSFAGASLARKAWCLSTLTSLRCSRWAVTVPPRRSSWPAPSWIRGSSRPSTLSRARPRLVPTCPTRPSTLAARRPSRILQKRTRRTRWLAPSPMATRPLLRSRTPSMTLSQGISMDRLMMQRQ